MTLKRFFLFTSLLFHFLLITACSENAMIQIGGEESSTPATVSVVSPPETVPPITFEHVATTENTTANYTALDPNIYSDFAYPETEIFVSNFTVNSIGGVINNAQPVLFYDMTENQWGIINLNGSPIKNGTRFNIMIPGNRGYHYQHQVVPGIGNQIQIPSDFMSLSEQEKAVIIVTPIYEIGSSLSSGAISVAREGDTWKILKEDGSAVGMNEKYNIYIPSATQTSKRVQLEVGSSPSVLVYPSGSPELSGRQFFTLNTTLSAGPVNEVFYLSKALMPLSLSIRKNNNSNLSNGYEFNILSVD